MVVKSNSFVRFLEEIDDPKNHFEINWPLGISNKEQNIAILELNFRSAISIENHVLTSSDIDEILSGGFVNFDVTISYMMFVPFETQVPMLGIVKKYNGFTVSSTLTTEA